MQNPEKNKSNSKSETKKQKKQPITLKIQSEEDEHDIARLMPSYTIYIKKHAMATIYWRVQRGEEDRDTL